MRLTPKQRRTMRLLDGPAEHPLGAVIGLMLPTSERRHVKSLQRRGLIVAVRREGMLFIRRA